MAEAQPTWFDVVGGVQRGLRETHNVLDRPFEQIPFDACIEYLDMLMQRLQAVRNAAMAAEPKGDGKANGEARAN